jgi:hypothetical protein
VRDVALKNALKEHILAQISHGFGDDYYESTPFPCEQELVTEIVSELIERDELPQAPAMRENLVRWLVFQRNTASIILLKSNAMLSSLLKESPVFAGSLLAGTAYIGYLDIIEVLVDAGAAVDSQNNYGDAAHNCRKFVKII